jgi:hypothetical protein
MMDWAFVGVAIDIADRATHHEFARIDLYEFHSDSIPGLARGETAGRILREQGTCCECRCGKGNTFHRCLLDCSTEL